MSSYASLLTSRTIDGNSATLKLTADWLQGRSGYGGWQAALALEAMRAVLGDTPPLRSLQANFIAPVPPGKVTAIAELLRRGKSVAQLEARIFVDGKPAFIALGIFGAERETAITLLPTAPSVSARPEDLIDWPVVEGAKPAFMQNFHLRWAAGTPPYSGDTSADAQIFVRFRDDPVATETHLVCLADAIPPSALSVLTTPAMLSTINWSLEVIHLPTAEEATDWFCFDTSLPAARSGYAWENTAIWSRQGKLIALSRQCVAVFG